LAGASLSEQTAPNESPERSDEPSQRFRLVVALLIALVSVLGAGVAYSASISSTRSSDLNQQALQEFLLRQQILTSGRAAVGEELRRVGPFQAEVLGQRILHEQAARFRASNPDVAALLDEQAQGEGALARTTAYFFFAAFPSIAPDGTVSYDRAQALNNLLGQYVIYQQLHPQATQARADDADSKTRHLIGVGVVLVLALFFLTLAEIAPRRFDLSFAGLGVVALVAALVLWGLVENSTL
jgi:hypothetical protein